eukprot:CAMPEP_0172312406 /NCGR_PEP_ID=MMETSP1058-20130122/17417_1 /TAXON_ID=83371 /ORGANISM="Detonula confervacea, Strain CCMP 353" /LENGTH=377 /DNA_ID=CAMNT_0013025851 /DNA_START=72 /DNA_END=1205 /DNA_ORIENTATION=-
MWWLQNCFALALLQVAAVESFQPVHHRTLAPRRTCSNFPSIATALHATSLDENELKSELSEYLKKRESANADDAAKAEVGKVIGGTRGNLVLEYVSGSPNKERVEDEVPDIFDYDELIKYGYADLVTSIMENGGRRAMYELMDLPEPATPKRLKKKKSAPKLVIDLTGETDEARYTGLKMSASMDDDAMGKALEEAARKVREGESLRKRLVEEDYVIPYADNTNKGPRQTPLWTPEMLDEAGKKAGEAQAWARKSRMGRLKKDPFEMLAVEGELRVYSVFVAITVALAWGNATPTALNAIGVHSDDFLIFFKIPSLALLAAGLGSAVVNSVSLAPPKNRSSFVWGLKGLMGGPLAVLQLRELGNLQTIGEIEEQQKA